MQNVGKLVWVSLSCRKDGVWLAQSEPAPRVRLTAPSRELLVLAIPGNLREVFGRDVPVDVLPLEAPSDVLRDDLRLAYAVLPVTRRS